MKKFKCITPNPILCHKEPCIIIVSGDPAPPENCPYRLWSDVECPDWEEFSAKPTDGGSER